MDYYRRIMKVQQDEIGATGKDEKRGGKCLTQSKIPN